MSAMGFREIKINQPVDYLDEVKQLKENFPTEQNIKLEIIREKQKNKVKFPNKNKKTSSKKIPFMDLVKQFKCDNGYCFAKVKVFNKGPQRKNRKHNHLFVLNPINQEK